MVQLWTNEGYTYLYDANDKYGKPKLMNELEDYMLTQAYDVDVIYRSTDYQPFLDAQEGDVIVNDRVSSWSLDLDVARVVYEGTESVLLTIESSTIPALYLGGMSSFPEEYEVLVAPGRFQVLS